MSTEQQLNGDSLRRQKKLSADYAEKNNWDLIESIEGRKLTDIGVSALHSKNAKEGALGAFLAAIKDGRVETGSVLMVENLDRLSRDSTLTAFDQFSSILNAGVEIVTLSDQRHYTKDSVNSNFSELFISLGIMFRSNEESEIKSKRLKAAWENKRKLASQKPLTRCRPAWLNYDEESESFTTITERADVVKKIFEMCISTCGLYGIARYLNESGVSVFGRGKYWHRSYIKKIICNRSVLGEFQPMTFVNNLRENAGEPIQNYYPQIINEDTFILANIALSQRNISDKGRKGKFFSNIFTGMVFCGSCGSKLTLRNRGSLPKGGKYLCCTNKLVKAGCKMPEWKIADFENILFEHLREVDFSLLINEEDPIADLEAKRNILHAKRIDTEKQLERIENTISNKDLSEESKSRLIKNLNKLVGDLAVQSEEIEEYESRIHQEKTKISEFDSVKMIKFLDLLKEKEDDFYTRSSVHQFLVKTVEKIILYQEVEKFAHEYEDSDLEVVSFRERNSFYKNKNLDTFVESRKFLKFALPFRRHITIRYTTGVLRQVQCGENRSHLGGWPLGSVFIRC